MVSACAWCATPFEPKPLAPAQRFCCARCRYAARDQTRHAARGTAIETACRKCGAAFTYLSGTSPRSVCDACRVRPAAEIKSSPAIHPKEDHR